MPTQTYTCTLTGAAATTYTGTYYINSGSIGVGKYDSAYRRTLIAIPSDIPDASKITSATLNLAVGSHGAATGTATFRLYEKYGNSGYTDANVSYVTKSFAYSSPGSTVSLDATTFLQAGISNLTFMPATEPPYTTCWVLFSGATVSITYKDTFTVTYNANGGTGAPGSQSTTTTTGSATFTVSSTTPTRTGYNFLGWSTSETGAVSYQPGETITITGDITLYAVWSANTCTVTLDPNGGTVSPTTITATLGQAYGTLPTPTKTGGTFGGWMLNGQLITAETICSTASNHTLTAYWSTVTCFYVKSADGTMKPGYCFRKATDGTMTTGIVYQKNADGTMTTV